MMPVSERPPIHFSRAGLIRSDICVGFAAVALLVLSVLS